MYDPEAEPEELPGERSRIMMCFCLLAGAALTVAGRLAYLQIGRYDESIRSVARKLDQREPVAAQRCRIADRDGVWLAHDRPVYEAWGEAYFRAAERGTRLAKPARLDRMVSDLAGALGLDERAARRFDGGAVKVLHARLAERLPQRLGKLRDEIDAAKLRGDRVLPRMVRVDFPIHSELTDAAALLALRDLDPRTTSRRRVPFTLYVHLERRYERVYAAPELTAGVVGLMREVHGDDGVEQIGASGLERLAVARPGAMGHRRVRVGARGTPFWTADRTEPAAPLTLHTTLDLELQRRARQHLMETAVASVVEGYGSPPQWGAIVAVDVPTGGLLAMASFLQDPEVHGRVADVWSGAFVPTQFVFEPGSVVKPLVFALALQRQRIAWSDRVDCSSATVPLGGRPVRRIYDSHPCGVLSPRGVLINSSNIGAVKLGMRLGSEGLEAYLQEFGVREPIRLPIPEREHRILPPRSIDRLHRREREIYTAPSLCFGYGAQVNVAHIARAYLTLLSGRRRELRLVDAVEPGAGATERRRVPFADAATPRFLSTTTVGRIKEAMVAIVDGAEGATAPRLTALLGELGAPRGLIGGKTGTSEYPPGVPSEQKHRTASFVGFAPAADPRVLVVCVLQKTGAGSFYGGSYAAPAVGRLLLDALRQSEYRNHGRRRVSALRPNQKTVRGRSTPLKKGR